jgi:hypothetical protein
MVMDENNQAFEQHDENTDANPEQPNKNSVGSGMMRVTNAALTGAVLGALGSAVAAALTGKGVADGVKTLVEGTKIVTENVKSAAIEVALDAVRNVTDNVNAIAEDNLTIDENQAPQQVWTSAEQERVVEEIPSVNPVKSVAAENVNFQQQEMEEKNNHVNQGVANDETSKAALVQLLLNQVSTELAMSFYEQLPGVVLAEIQRLATNPTLEEKQRIKDSWAKALEPLAMAIIQSGQSFNTNVLTTSNGYPKQLNEGTRGW